MEVKKGQLIQTWNGRTGEVLDTQANNAHILFADGKRAWEPCAHIVQAADTYTEKDAKFLSAKDKLTAFKEKKNAKTAAYEPWGQIMAKLDFMDRCWVDMANDTDKDYGQVIDAVRQAYKNDEVDKAVSLIDGALANIAQERPRFKERNYSFPVWFKDVKDMILKGQTKTAGQESGWVIYNQNESDIQEEPMYWSNDTGWSSLSGATVFTEEEKNSQPHIPGVPGTGSKWVPISQAKASKTAGHPNDFATKYQIGDILVPAETSQCPELGYVHILDIDLEKKVYVCNRRPVDGLDLSKQEPEHAYGVRYEVSISELDGDKKLVKYASHDFSKGCPKELVAVAKDGDNIKLIFSDLEATYTPEGEFVSATLTTKSDMGSLGNDADIPVILLDENGNQNWHGNLDKLFSDNEEFDDTVKQQIRNDLEEKGESRYGGGASPEFRILYTGQGKAGERPNATRTATRRPGFSDQEIFAEFKRSYDGNIKQNVARELAFTSAYNLIANTFGLSNNEVNEILKANNFKGSVSATVTEASFSDAYKTEFGFMVRDLGFDKLNSIVANKRLAKKVEAMGRDRLIPMTIDVQPFQVYPGAVITPSEWNIKQMGKPTPENIKKFVEVYNASLEPDGVNSHVGRKGAIYGGIVTDQRKGEQVAEWKDESIIQQYKDKPMFEVVEAKERLAKKVKAISLSDEWIVFVQDADSRPLTNFVIRGKPEEEAYEEAKQKVSEVEKDFRGSDVSWSMQPLDQARAAGKVIATEMAESSSTLDISEVRQKAKELGLKIKTHRLSWGPHAEIADTKSSNSTAGNVFVDSPEVQDFLKRLNEFKTWVSGRTVTMNGEKVRGLTASKTVEATSNRDVIEMFINDSFPKDKRPVWGSQNLKITKKPNGWALVNYATPILYRGSDGKMTFNTDKYSNTTTQIQNLIRRLLSEAGVQAEETDENGINEAIDKPGIDDVELAAPATAEALEATSSLTVQAPGHVDESKWNKAKDAVKSSSGKAIGDFGDKEWATVSTVYKNMGGTFKSKKSTTNLEDKEAKAKAIGDDKTRLLKRLKEAVAVMTDESRTRFGKYTEDLENKRLLSEDGKWALEWRMRRYPDEPESPENQQTSVGTVVSVGYGEVGKLASTNPEDNGYYVMGEHTSVAWTKTKEEAEKLCTQMNYRGGANYKVEPSGPAGNVRSFKHKIASLLKKAERLGNYDFDIYGGTTWKLEAGDGDEKKIVRVKR